MICISDWKELLRAFNLQGCNNRQVSHPHDLLTRAIDVMQSVAKKFTAAHS
jgi:hypothetical protein